MTDKGHKEIINYLGNLTLRKIKDSTYLTLEHYKRAMVGIYTGILQYRQLGPNDKVMNMMDERSFVYVFYKDEDFDEQWEDFMDSFKEWLVKTEQKVPTYTDSLKERIEKREAKA